MSSHFDYDNQQGMRSKINFDYHRGVQSLVRIVFTIINIICFYK